MCIYMYIYTHVNICKYVCNVSFCFFKCMYMCTFEYIYIYIHVLYIYISDPYEYASMSISLCSYYLAFRLAPASTSSHSSGPCTKQNVESDVGALSFREGLGFRVLGGF